MRFRNGSEDAECGDAGEPVGEETESDECCCCGEDESSADGDADDEEERVHCEERTSFCELQEAVLMPLRPAGEWLESGPLGSREPLSVGVGSL